MERAKAKVSIWVHEVSPFARKCQSGALQTVSLRNPKCHPIPPRLCYAPPMPSVSPIEVPQDSLLAAFGGQQSYRDCFAREVPGEVTLADLIERFYASPVFLPERLILRLIGRKARLADARRLARGEAQEFGAWKVVERRSGGAGGMDEILLESKETGTASWLAVEPLDQGTRLLFGSWVGAIDQSGWRMMERLHVWYSRVLLAGV